MKTLNTLSNHAPKNEWLADFFERKDNFFIDNSLNKKNQLGPFCRYLRDANLIDKSNRFTPFADFISLIGWESETAQGLILVNLVFNNLQFEWYTKNLDVGRYYPKKVVIEMLLSSGVEPSKAGKFDAHDSICYAFKRMVDTPLGTTLRWGVVTDEGDLVRTKCSVSDARVVLYGFTVKNINSAYEGIKFSTKDFSLPLSCGNDTQWAELLTEMNQNSHSIEAVFEKNGLTENLEENFYENITGHNYRNWLYFIAIKIKSTSLNNCYLRFVLENCCSFEDFSRHILNDIIDIPHTDKRFLAFYLGRKKLVKRFPEPDIANFITNNRKDSFESIYRLTDNTLEERKEIISWVSQHGFHEELERIYPRLSSYLKKYIFRCNIHAELLTDYFDAYRHQKLLNKLQPEFIEKVEELARSRKFNQLPTRDEIVDSIEKEDTYLYWLDALGVEYLGLIEDMVRQRGLSAQVHITRAELPTITSINKGFYESWPSHSKKKNASLDEVKHKEAGGYNFIDNQLPIHLAKELDIIQDMINEAAIMLAQRRYKRFLIVSDHGASRLAVIRRKEEKYETDSSGEHSGRCCKTFQPYELPFAAEENGYLVLADYGRFKGSRSANVEVHGGASLEEVVIPVIDLSLRDNSITVSLVQETVPVDYKEGAVIQVFINSPVRNNVSVVLGGKLYPGKQADANHYDIKLHDIKKAGGYSADVYAGDDLIGHISFRTQGKSGKINDDFDNLF